MSNKRIGFGHLVPSNPRQFLAGVDAGLDRVAAFDALRFKPLLSPPATRAAPGLSFIGREDTAHHKAVEWAGRWISREFEYSAGLFTRDTWKPRWWEQHLYPWLEAFIFVADTERGPRVIGAGGAHMAGYANLPATLRELVFVWFHPLYRRQGHLSAIWPQLTQQWGPFIVQRPISPEMEAFLSKQPRTDLTTTNQSAIVAAYGG